MKAMTEVNSSFCYSKNSNDPEAQDKYSNNARIFSRQFIDEASVDTVFDIVFERSGKPRPSQAAHGEVCLFCCVKNDEKYLPAFLDHYRRIGVARFFFVDDGSDTSIAEWLEAEDVDIFKPRVGSFRTSKTLWLEALINQTAPEDAWVLTVDCDEFFDLPDQFETIGELCRDLEVQGRNLLPAILVDMVPGPGVDAETLENADLDFLEVFDHHGLEESPVPLEYSEIESIRWGFGPYASLSWRLDVRNHAFGTIDSLRKIPLFKVQSGRHLNQGFHTLLNREGRNEIGSELWDSELILPILHYKLVKLLSSTSRERATQQVIDQDKSQYYSRTSENIAQIFGGGEDALHKIRTLPILPYSDGYLHRLGK